MSRRKLTKQAPQKRESEVRGSSGETQERKGLRVMKKTTRGKDEEKGQIEKEQGKEEREKGGKTALLSFVEVLGSPDLSSFTK